MANVPGDLRYTKDHEWAKPDGKRFRVGITAFAQEQLGDVVFVELPKVGTKVTARAGVRRGRVREGRVGSLRPAVGEIVDINTALPNAPQTVNQDPYGQGWMIVIAPSKADEWDALLTAAQYEQFLSEGH